MFIKEKIRFRSSTGNPILFLFLSALSTLFYMTSCKENVIKEYPSQPANPFASIDYSDGVMDDIYIDSSTFLGLHTYIFKPTCAVPGCHDGNFEPDFRSVQSSYDELVYQNVVKNDAAGSFTYRVDPGDTSASWLHERITKVDPVLGKMPLYDTLSKTEIALIGNWIMNGAHDIMGVSPILPNYQPAVFGVLAYWGDTTGLRLDTNRADILSPFLLPPGEEVELWIGIYDLDEQGEWLPGYNLGFNKLKISPDPFEMSDEPFLDLETEDETSPFYGPIFMHEDHLEPYFHHITINTADFSSNNTYFIRAYVQDQHHQTPTEFPKDDSPIYVITLMSFIIL